MAFPHGGVHRTTRRGARAADRRSRGAARRYLHNGSEPRWARSDLAARRALSRVFAPLFAAGAAGFAVLAALSKPTPQPDRWVYAALAGFCLLMCAVALVDLLVIRRRETEQRRWGR